MEETAGGAEPRDLEAERKSRRLGRILVEQGALSEARLRRALEDQQASGRRLGEILHRRGWARGEAVAAAVAAQRGLPRADLGLHPLDPALGRPEDAALCLARRQAPWRREGGEVVWAVADAASPPVRGRSAAAPTALCDPDALAAAILAAYGPALAERAAARPPEGLSVRAGVAGWQKAVLAALAAAALAALALAPGTAAPVLLALIVALNAGNAALRIAVLGAAFRRGRTPPPAPQPETTALADRRPPPRVTLLVPLLREPETLPVLFAALEALDWPAELLDVILILEADDHLTRAEIERRRPPPFCRVLIAPPGLPRTKPRALNLALDAAEGEIVGIYDAEDRPEPDQIRRVVEALRAAPPEVACVQARLAYFNARESWMTRCFAIEYAMWFDVLLTGFRELRLPIPLGGTSVFFRRGALEALGAWDSHNVTEDADLGMRLARAGFRCEVIDSTTYEEANGRVLPWIRQRSRWLKGYALTWLTHMRAPLRLLRELGPVGFLGFQGIFLGALVAYFGLPVLWAAWIAVAAGCAPVWVEDTPAWAFGTVAVVQLSGWLAMIAAALLATRRRGQGWLAPWIPTLVLYWPLGSLAAYLALVELFVAPTRWRKTTHGVGRFAQSARRDALRTRAAPPAAAEAAPLLDRAV